ncbi:MAG: hypothetical protein NZM25_07910 [Leptospiraceae bacterium]|nr:hypothetical protein [Leptospiraceae bacterium]MDW8305525.1 hypothetical protein [Leptospiraceae bacterium]
MHVEQISQAPPPMETQALRQQPEQKPPEAVDTGAAGTQNPPPRERLVDVYA